MLSIAHIDCILAPTSARNNPWYCPYCNLHPDFFIERVYQNNPLRKHCSVSKTNFIFLKFSAFNKQNNEISVKFLLNNKLFFTFFEFTLCFTLGIEEYTPPCDVITKSSLYVSQEIIKLNGE
jgi:hypothetical protein